MPVIEYVYSAHSAFAYLGSDELMRLCAKHGATLVHRPILLSPVVEAQRSRPFRDRTQTHVDYFFGREIERWAEYRDVPILSFRPTFHDADYSVASGMILALGPQGALVDALAHRFLEAHWRDDANLSDLSVLSDLADTLGHDGKELVKEGRSDKAQAMLRANSDWAAKVGVFGSPTYFVDGDPFYGQDRLELIDRALSMPFAPSRWVNPPVDAG